MKFRSFTFDAKKKSKTKQFKQTSTAEKAFYRQLKKVAKYSGHIVEAHTYGDKIQGAMRMQKSLEEYSELITPWAERQASKMVARINSHSKRAFKNNSNSMFEQLQMNLADSDILKESTLIISEQVKLIKSIPIEAGLRAQKLAQESFFNGTRASEIAKELSRTTEVTESRAMLIAVTETARANAAITQTRAKAVGAIGYIWRATRDEACRESHRKMNGKYVLYAKPPTLSDGTTGHAGTFPRCRCYQDPVFED